MFSFKVLSMVLAFVSLTCFVVEARAQTTWHVDDDASSGGDGTTWSTAYDSLSTALTAAQSGDQIWVAAGRYVGNFTLALEVEVYGGFDGTEVELGQRDWTANPTILDGNQTGSVVISPSGATATTRIDGFTITNGNAEHGGGLYLDSSSPSIANNTISGNSANERGGGLYMTKSSPAIANNTITANGAMSGNRWAGGGGLYLAFSSPTIANNTIIGNIASSYGGGLYVYRCSPTVTNTIVAFNSSGIYRYDTGTPTMRHNCVYGNAEYDYSGLADPTGTDGNISADPLLAGPQYGNAHVQPDSPCVGAGDNDDAFGNLDMDGELRIQPPRGTIDIGADESGGTVWPPGPYVIVRVSHAGEDANDGSSWALAKRTVQAGIDAASALGGEVWVEAGTYSERATLYPYAYLYGGFAGTETERDQRNWDANVTTLDGQHQGSVISAQGGYEPVGAIDGFTITNGNAEWGGGMYLRESSPTIANNTITGNSARWGGAGLYLRYSSSKIANNTITNGNTEWGGGVYLRYSSAFIVNNMITGNIAAEGGGGVLLSYSSATIANNTIAGNGARSVGGGLSLNHASSTIVNNTITGNEAYGDYGDGGGLWVNSSSSAAIVNNTIMGNDARDKGGGLYVVYASPTMANNAIASNNARRGGGVYLYYSSPTIANNTITGNIATDWGGGLYIYVSAPTMVNTIVAFNSSGISRYSDTGTPTLRYNCVYGNRGSDYGGLTDPTGTDGNISADPVFVQDPDPGPDELWGTGDDDPGDLQLSSGSPCIDAGDNNGVPPDTPDLDHDGNTTELLPLDPDGNARFVDDPATPDTGDPGALGPPIVDMGAFEFVNPCGNSVMDPGEECDGGVGCTDCLCVMDFEPTAPPSVDCQPICGNGSIDSGEECDRGLGCTDCLCDADFEPTAPPSPDCQATCGNGSVDPGEECDGMDDTACPEACLSDCTCGPFCGNGACDPGEDSCSCPNDCGTPPLREVLGSTCADGIDNDCDGLTDSADRDCAAIPTVSAWGVVIMTLLLLAGAKVYFGRRRAVLPVDKAS